MVDLRQDRNRTPDAYPAKQFGQQAAGQLVLHAGPLPKSAVHPLG